jgi:hypothetical protein
MKRLLVSARIAPCSETPFLAVRHALEIVDPDDCQVWRESFASGAFLAAPKPVPVVLSHDGLTIGTVSIVVPFREWHVADMLIEAEDDQLDRVRPGTAVSIDARSVKRTDDADLRIRRHSLIRLDAVAILGAGEVPYYEHAKITAVRELPAPRMAEGEVVCKRGVIRRAAIGRVLAVR